jgi:hypothetical protein
MGRKSLEIYSLRQRSTIAIIRSTKYAAIATGE